MRYAATMHAHCGMSYPLLTGEIEDCRAEVAKFLRDRRTEGYAVSVLEKGKRFETTEPDDSAMVPDDAGVVTIEPSPSLCDCFECGCDFQPEGRWDRVCPDCRNPETFGEEE